MVATIDKVKYATPEQIPNSEVFADYWREVVAPTINNEVLGDNFYKMTVERFERFGFSEDDAAVFVERTFANWGERLNKLQEICDNPDTQALLKNQHGIDATAFNILTLLEAKISGQELTGDQREAMDVLSQMVVGKGVEFGGQTGYGLTEDVNLFSDWSLDVIMVHEMTHYLISKKFSYLEDTFRKIDESANDANPYGGVTKQFLDNMMRYVALGNDFQEAVAHSYEFIFFGERQGLIMDEEFGSYKDRGAEVDGTIAMVKFVRGNLGKISQGNFDEAIMAAYAQFEEAVKMVDFNKVPEDLSKLKGNFYEKFYSSLNGKVSD